MSRVPRVTEGEADPLWEAIARHTAGEATPDDTVVVEQHLAAHPVDAALVQALSDHTRSSALARDVDVNVDVEAALVAVRRRMLTVEESDPSPLRVVAGGASRTMKQRVNWKQVVFAVAATLVATAGIAQWRMQRSVPGTPVTVVTTTDAAKVDTLTLLDGTRVVLGPMSRLVVDEGYLRNHRTVTLDGMAHFIAAHGGRHQFIVRTAHAEVRDIGTAFTVRSDSVHGVRVSVTHGQVRVTRWNGGAAVDLVAGDRAEIDAREAVVARNVNVDADTAWTTGSLVYRDTPLAAVAADLSRWFDARIDVDEALARRTVRATVDTDSLVPALRAIGLALDADVQQTETGWTIRSRSR